MTHAGGARLWARFVGACRPAVGLVALLAALCQQSAARGWKADDAETAAIRYVESAILMELRDRTGGEPSRQAALEVARMVRADPSVMHLALHELQHDRSLSLAEARRLGSSILRTDRWRDEARMDGAVSRSRALEAVGIEDPGFVLFEGIDEVLRDIVRGRRTPEAAAIIAHAFAEMAPEGEARGLARGLLARHGFSPGSELGSSVDSQLAVALASLSGKKNLRSRTSKASPPSKARSPEPPITKTAQAQIRLSAPASLTAPKPPSSTSPPTLPSLVRSGQVVRLMPAGTPDPGPEREAGARETEARWSARPDVASRLGEVWTTAARLLRELAEKTAEEGTRIRTDGAP